MKNKLLASLDDSYKLIKLAERKNIEKTNTQPLKNENISIVIKVGKEMELSQLILEGVK